MVLLECELPINKILVTLNKRKRQNLYYFVPPILSEIKSYFKIFTKFKPDYLKPLRDNGRMQAKNIAIPSFESLNLVVIHFQSKLRFDGADQDAHSHEITQFIEAVERETGHDRTLVLGDFKTSLI